MNLDSSIRELKGIGEKTEELFHNIGVYTIRDILLYFPREYHQYETPKAVSEATLGRTALRARPAKKPVVRNTGNMQVTLAEVQEGSASISLVWFRSPYIKSLVRPGQDYIFYGEIKKKGGRMSMEQPRIYSPSQYQELQDTLQPIYRLTAGMTNQTLKKAIQQALACADLFEDLLPQGLREQYRLMDYAKAVEEMHFPFTRERLCEARRRLVFEEFFWFLFRMRLSKEECLERENAFSFGERDYVEGLLSKLPYDLTRAQLRAIQEIQSDMRSHHVMQRLVQGDVGSGKTIVAFLAMADVAHSGYQSAIMAPTEVLARQHYESFLELSDRLGLGLDIILLTGALTAKERREAYGRMQSIPNALVIGTHALIQEKAVFNNLALVITDEQHRFGVKQRENLGRKGEYPHILVMSATPIPRTLALILYGDLDISIIDELPAHRLPIKNCVVGIEFRKKAYAFIDAQIQKGHQAYVICPLVEESEHMEAENVTQYAKALEAELPKWRIATLHGKMTTEEKNRIMGEFSEGKIHVLVSTTVIEVGINVPNATVMMIEDAQRFGLAQLHQLRGRVGRGKAQSYCIMINTSQSPAAQERLEVLNQSKDGFFIAKEDLRLRGQGDFLGVRQSGMMGFEIGDVYTDADVLKQASDAVSQCSGQKQELIDSYMKLPNAQNVTLNL